MHKRELINRARFQPGQLAPSNLKSETHLLLVVAVLHVLHVLLTSAICARSNYHSHTNTNTNTNTCTDTDTNTDH
jgi:hypothetical protein